MAELLTKKQSLLYFHKRANFVFFVIFLVVVIVLAAVFHLQVIRGSVLREQAEGQYISSSSGSFDRGNIFFESYRDGPILAAGQMIGYRLAVNPQKAREEDLRAMYPLLREYGYKRSMQDSIRILQSLREKGTIYFELLNKIEKDDAEKIKKVIEEKKEGKIFRLDLEKWRVYPLHENAAPVVGFLSYGSDNTFKARYGLEREYNKVLSRDTKDIYANFFALVFRGIKKSMQGELTFEGDIVSTIDPQVQIFLDTKMQGVQEKWQSQKTGGLVMDAQTGEVYAMSSIPGFDPNHYGDYPLSHFRNSLVSDRYEFGSVMKPLVMAIALDKHLVNADTSYFDRGSIVVGKHTIHNFDKRGRGWVTMQDVLNQSLNTGMVFVAKKIPKETFRAYMHRYGFSQKTGIDLPGDTKGLTSNLKSKRDIEFANMSFGQGIAVSPVAFVKAASALAHKGVPVQPHLVSSIRYLSGIEKTLDWEEGERVFSEETAGEITRMLVNVFDAYRGGKVKIPHYRIAAKTGTAQIAGSEGGYEDGKHLHSFFAYFPAYDPKYIVFLYTVDPKGVKYSSQTLIDPFRDLAQFLIHYKNIPPDR